MAVGESTVAIVGGVEPYSNRGGIWIEEVIGVVHSIGVNVNVHVLAVAWTRQKQADD